MVADRSEIDRLETKRLSKLMVVAQFGAVVWH